MEEKSIGFVKYSKLSQESDAFFYNEKLSPYFDLEIFGNHSANNLENEDYTAGTTNDPDDYELPDITSTILPNKLLRLNSFNNSSKQKLFALDDFENSEFTFPKIEEKTEEEKYIETNFMASDAFRFMNLLKNKNIKINKNTENNKISISSNKLNIVEIIIDERKLTLPSVVESTNEGIRNLLPIGEKSNNITNINNTEEFTTQKNELYDYTTVINNSRMESVSSNDFSYDIYNNVSSSYNDFSQQVNNTQIIQEVKDEIINNVSQTINNIQNTIQNQQNITKTEIKNVENKIIQVIEEKLDEKETKIIDKISEQSKKDLSQFKRDFLNS